MKINRIYAGVLLVTILFAGCKKEWDEHYRQIPETVNKNVWEALKEETGISLFVDLMEEFEYDTLFDSDNTYTLFIPDDEAFSRYPDSVVETRTILDYHISKHFIQTGHINGSKVIQTFGEKYVLFEKNTGGVSFDGIASETESPLYINGKYFILDDVAIPRPNLYEYFALNNPILKKYIDSKDSIELDKAESIPIGFDDDGNTVYDSVTIINNEFEDEFFPVRKEFRNNTATVVFPKEEAYNEALDMMADELGERYQDHKNIPLNWQYETFIPYLLEHGVFQNSLEPFEFVPSGLAGDTLKLKNIQGDSIIIDYEPYEKTPCSNGYAYNLKDFRVPDTLFTGAIRFEGEWLLDRSGENKFKWVDSVEVGGTGVFDPKIVDSYIFSNDSALLVSMPLGFNGTYTVEFDIDKLFPRRYLMAVRTSLFIGGIYHIYFNDVLVKEMNYYEFVLNPYFYLGATGKVYEPVDGYILFDCLINNENEYGDARLRFEYVGSGNVPTNGLVFDYIDFIPLDE